MPSSSWRNAPLRGMRAAPRGGLRDLPGVSRGQELADVAGSALRYRLLLLLEHEVFVHRRVDGGEHADRDREVRREEVGDQLRRVDVLLVVDPEARLRNVLGADHFGRDAL